MVKGIDLVDALKIAFNLFGNGGKVKLDIFDRKHTQSLSPSCSTTVSSTILGLCLKYHADYMCPHEIKFKAFFVLFFMFPYMNYVFSLPFSTHIVFRIKINSS